MFAFTALILHFKFTSPCQDAPLGVTLLSRVISKPLVAILSLSLLTSVIFVDWSSAVIKLFPKWESKQEVSTKPPISLTSIVCQSMERLIKGPFTAHGISNVQHGFVKFILCLTHLHTISETTTRLAYEDKSEELCYLDINKADDSVSSYNSIDCMVLWQNDTTGSNELSKSLGKQIIKRNTDKKRFNHENCQNWL